MRKYSRRDTCVKPTAGCGLWLTWSGLDAGAALALEEVEETVFVEVEEAPAVEFLIEEGRFSATAAGFREELLDPLQQVRRLGWRARSGWSRRGIVA